MQLYCGLEIAIFAGIVALVRFLIKKWRSYGRTEETVEDGDRDLDRL